MSGRPSGRPSGFGCRLEQAETMDRPDCDPAMLRRTLRQFELINRLFSSSRHLIRRCIFPVVAAEPGREYTLLDVGAGGGDVARWVVRVARRRGWRVRVTALDADARLIPWLTEWMSGYPEIQVRSGRLEDLGEVSFDFVFSNHVLHHVPAGELSDFIGRCHRAARCALVLNDLRRSSVAWAGFAVFGALFLRRSYATADGLTSIRRAYRRAELETLLPPGSASAGCRVVELPPARLAVIRGGKATGARPPASRSA